MPSQCPPFPFKIELEMAIQKHPQAEWEKMQPFDMHGELLGEVDELKSALWAGELNGDHGIIREAVHVQVVAQRIIDEMKRRHR